MLMSISSLFSIMGAMAVLTMLLNALCSSVAVRFAPQPSAVSIKSRCESLASRT